MAETDSVDNAIDILERSIFDATAEPGKPLEAVLEFCELLKEHGFVDSAGRADTVRFTRAAAAVSSWAMNTTEELSQDQYRWLMERFQHLVALFFLSGYRNADHIVTFLLANRAEDLDVRLLLLFLQPSTEVEIDASAVFDASPMDAALWCFSVVGSEFCISPRATDLRDRLLTSLDFASIDRLHRPYFVPMSRAWMHCSYSTLPDKHQFKRQLNTLIKRSIDPVDRGSEIQEKRAKRRIVVVIEVMHEHHAMFRSFSDWLSQLAANYSLVAVFDPALVDDKVLSLFDQRLVISGKDTIESVAQRIFELRADMVFYPSVGMNYLGICLANYRLAPLQTVGLGHPATTMSSEIDYMLAIRGAAERADRFSEAVVEIDGMRLRKPEKLRSVSASIQQGKESIDIAIASRSFKLNPNFLRTLKDIEGAVSKSIRWHFLCGMTGVLHQQIAYEIAEVLPRSVVYPYMPYGDYVDALSQCELHFESFPFGGTNSNIDSLAMGMPVLCMDGDEPHSKIDAVMLQTLRAPDWLVAADRDSYVAAAVRLIDDDALRKNVSQQVLEAMDGPFFVEDASRPASVEFVQAVSWLIENHSNIKDTDTRLFRPADSVDKG